MIVDKMELLGKMQLTDKATTFADRVMVILNEAHFELHENDFGSLIFATGAYWKLVFQ